jgi:2-aminoadipate transaminase
VIVEEMTYGGAITRLKRRGARIMGVPVDHDRLRADALEAALSSLAAEGVRAKYVYAIPTVQNPNATVMSEARRREILAVAARFDVPVFEDECHADLTSSGVRPPALRALDGDGRVVHIGSFSKTIAPALRLGYFVADWPLMSRILGVKNDGGSGTLEQMVLAQFCREHFDANLARLRTVLQGKAQVLAESLRERFGDTVRFEAPPGGIFLWMQVADPVDTTRLYEAAGRAGIALNPGAEWMTDLEAGRRWMRLCFAHPSPGVIREGVSRLAEVCRQEFGVPAARHR